MSTSHQMFIKKMMDCMTEVGSIARQLGYNYGGEGYCFRVPLDKGYELSIAVLPDTISYHAVETLLFKDGSSCSKNEWDYSTNLVFYGDTASSDAKNIQTLKNEIQRVKDLINNSD